MNVRWVLFQVYVEKLGGKSKEPRGHNEGSKGRWPAEKKIGGLLLPPTQIFCLKKSREDSKEKKVGSQCGI